MKYCAFIASLSRCLSISKYFDSPLKLLTISPNNGDSKGSGDRSILITLIDNIDYFFSNFVFNFHLKDLKWHIKTMNLFTATEIYTFLPRKQALARWSLIKQIYPLTSSPPKPPKIKIIKQQTPKFRSQRKNH